jgi:hypothetical protein
MQNVPKIVRERLQAAAPSVVRAGADSSAHPDADLLTAFAECSLPEFERASVLDHLARCGECREVVALALPASEEMSGPAVRGVRTSTRGWLTWPALRWGLVATGVVAVASVGILRYRGQPAAVTLQKSVPVEVAANEPKKQDLDRFVAPEKREKEKLQASAAPAFADSLSAPNSAVAGSTVNGSTVDAKKSAPQPEGSAMLAPQIKSGTNSYHGGVFAANTLPHGGPRVPNQWAQQNTVQNNAQNIAPAAPPPSAYPAQAGGQVAGKVGAPSASETVEATSAAPVPTTEAQNLEERQSKDLPTIDRAKPLVPSVASPASASGAAVATINPYQAGVAGGVSAQSAPGKMLGYVVDPSGAVLPNVRVTVTPSNPGGAATAVTNSQGAWLIAGLPTGSYKALAEAPGFRTTVLDLNYNADRPSLYRFTLDVGSAAETVEVTAENALLQTEGANVGGPIHGRNFTQLSTVTAGLMPRWMISATGGLQRSLDQGKTWQAVDVKTNPAYATDSASATSLQISAETSETKKSKDKDSGKLHKQAAAPLTFRAVAAAGSDVWAGGMGGALYHSGDAGINWARIVPASAGTTLTGDILSIDFPDPQHGKLSTSTSEVWITGDGGQTWQKQ